MSSFQPLAPFSLVVFAVLGLVCYRLSIRWAREAGSAELAGRTTLAANARQMRFLGALLIAAAFASLVMIFLRR